MTSRKKIKKSDEDTNYLKDSMDHPDLGDSLENELNEQINEGENNIDYDQENILLMQQVYDQPMIDYEKLFYGDKSNQIKSGLNLDKDYWENEVRSNAETEKLSVDEAKETFMNIQYATVLGSETSMSSSDKRKFDLWIKFNSALFGLFENNYSITRDINYGYN